MIKLPFLFCLMRKGPFPFAASKDSIVSLYAGLRAVIVFSICILLGSAFIVVAPASFAKAAHPFPCAENMGLEYVDTLFECQLPHKGSLPARAQIYAKKVTKTENTNFSSVIKTHAENSRRKVREVDRQDYNNTLALSRGVSSPPVQEFFSQQKNRNNIPKVANTFHATGQYFYKVILNCELCLQPFMSAPLLVDKRAVVAERPGSPRASPLSM